MKTKLLRRIRKRFEVKIVHYTLSTNKWLIKDKRTGIIWEKFDFYGLILVASYAFNQYFYFQNLLSKNRKKREQYRLKQEFK